MKPAERDGGRSLEGQYCLSMLEGKSGGGTGRVINELSVEEC